MRVLIIFLFSFLLIACGTESKKFNENKVNSKTISKAIPAVDSAFLHELSQEFEFESKLSGDSVQLLSSVLSQLKVNGHFYKVIPDFLRIDSLKRNGLYETYLRKMDIGFLQNAEAYFLKSVQLNSQEEGKIWFIKYNSYEACPYYHGVDVFLSLYEDQTIKTTIQIGSNYSVIDPPMAFESILESKQEDNKLLISLMQKEIEIDDKTDIIEENKQTFTFNLTNGTFQE